MNIRIVRRPIGEAPEWVREAWIGLLLPLALDRRRRWKGYGVLSGPRHWLSALWALVAGKTLAVEGYLLDPKLAVDRLADLNPEAAAWWRENTPGLLDGKHYFIFDADACEPAPRSPRIRNTEE